MKTKFILSFAALVMALSSNSQIKIFPGGSVSYGSTTAPSGGEKHKFTGDLVVTSTTSTPSSALRLRGNNVLSSATTPDYTWYGNDQTGFFHPASNVIGFTTGGTERARITTYGNLLMGTTSLENARINTVTYNYGGIYSKATYAGDWGPPVIDSETDRVNSVTYRGVLPGTGATFYVTGGGWIYNAGGIYNGSDKNIKDDIKNIDSALAKVLQLNGVTYKLKREKQNPNLYPVAQEYMGVVAQDVEKVAPQAVKVVLDGSKAVNYDMLIGLLIEALKEQNSKVTQLQSEVNNCCTKKGDAQQNRLINTTDETSTELYIGNSYIRQNAPNPFSKETSIEYFITEKNADSSILVFDMNGKLLKTYKLNGSGKGNITVSGNEFSPGMYYYSLIVNAKEVGTKKMILTE